MKALYRLWLISLCMISVGVVQAQMPFVTDPSEHLSQSALKKMDQAAMRRLLALPNHSIIVLFTQPDVDRLITGPSDSVLRSVEEKRLFAQHKAKIFERLNRSGLWDVVVLNDYASLPMAWVTTTNQWALVELLNDPEVVRVYENKPYSLTLQESLPLINADVTAAQGYSGQGVSVAVIDTGIDYQLDIFGNCEVAGKPENCRVKVACDAKTCEKSPASQSSKQGHGTNVAAIVASVAPAADIVSINIFKGKYAWTSDIIAAVDWSITHQRDYNIVAMNLSVGDNKRHTNYCHGSWEHEVFERAKAAGIVPVIASGNNAFTDGVSSPACAIDAVRVGAVYDAQLGRRSWGICTDATTEADQVACFSNSGDLVTVLAPGSVIDAGGYKMSGTSQATPHVAGAIAVLAAVDMQMHGKYDANNMVAVLVATGKPIVDQKNQLTKPRIDLWAAVEAMQVVEAIETKSRE